MQPKKEIKHNRKMTSEDVRQIVAELHRWEAGELGSKLTWLVLEKNCGFTRAALNAKPEIKQAYSAAKTALRKGGITSTAKAHLETAATKERNDKLRRKLDESQAKNVEMQLLWQRVAYNLMAKGHGSISKYDQPIPPGEPVPDQETVDKVIGIYDRPLPARARK
jgi:hypothetical protein